MGNHPDTYRELRAIGRYQVPASQVLELCADGYRVLGDKAAVEAVRTRALLLDTVPTSAEHAAAEADLLDHLPDDLVRTTVRRELTRLIEEGLVVRMGKGRRGDPFRYYQDGPEEVEL